MNRITLLIASASLMSWSAMAQDAAKLDIVDPKGQLVCRADVEA